MRNIEIADAEVQRQSRADFPVVLNEKLDLMVVVARLPELVQLTVCRRLAEQKVGMRMVCKAACEVE